MTEDTLGPGWEAVTVDICGVPTLRRIEVPGGWLYLAGILGEGATLCFVPTPRPPVILLRAALRQLAEAGRRVPPEAPDDDHALIRCTMRELRQATAAYDAP